jgi:hypothetical protein
MVVSITQAEILRLYRVDNLSVKEIASRRQTTIWAVYKILKRIGKENSNTHQKIKGGGLGVPIYDIGHFRHAHPLNTHPIRLHAQQFQAKIYNRTDRFNRLIGKSFKVDGSTIHVYRDNVMVWSGRSFYGDSAENSYSNAWEYWQIFFKQLERKLGVCIFKPSGAVIRTVKIGHFAEIENELAKKSQKEHQKIEIKGLSPDNRVWLLADNSFNLKELETVHPDTALIDMGDIVSPLMNRLRSEPEILNKLDLRMGYIEGQFIELLKIMVENKEKSNFNLNQSNLNDKPDYLG